MDKNLLEEVMVFKKNQENFMNILPYFNKKIKHLSYKLKYPESETDLISLNIASFYKCNLYWGIYLIFSN